MYSTSFRQSRSPDATNRTQQGRHGATMLAVAVSSVAIVIKLIRLHRIRSIRMRHIATEGAAWSV